MLVSWLIQGAPLGPVPCDVFLKSFPSEEVVKYLKENIPTTRAKSSWTRLSAAFSGLAFAGQGSVLVTSVGLDNPRDETETMKMLVLSGVAKGMARLCDVGLALEKAILSSFATTRVLAATNLVDLQALKAGKLERLQDAVRV